MRIRVGLTQKFVLLGTLIVTLTFVVTNVVSYQWHRATILSEISEKPALIARTGVLSLDGEKVACFLRDGRPHGEIADALLAALYDIRNRNDPRATVSLLVREPRGTRVVEVLSTETALLPRIVEAGDPRYETISAVLEAQRAATSRPYETERGTFLSAYAPLGSGNEILALLEVAYPINVSETLWETRGRMLLLSYFLGFLSTLGLATYVARRFVVPIQDLSRAIQGMSQGDATYPIPIRSSDEIGQLAETFDRMRTTIETQRKRLEEQRDALLRTKGELEALTASLDAQVEAKTQELKRTLSKLKDTQTLLIHKEKMASVGELAGGIAHEINTPLGVIVTRIGYLLSVLQEEDPQNEIIEDLEAVYRQAIRISKIIRSLLDYARQQPKPRRPVAVTPLVQGCLDLVAERCSPKVAIEVDLPSDLPKVEVDQQRIEFVFVNLLQNALDAMP
ncbi:MAG: sensor histidine kinase, partial [Deltaproteobacteria bacterium]